MNARLAAVYALYDVIVAGRSLTATLAEQFKEISTPADKGLCQEITYGTLRHYASLQQTLRPFLKKPIPTKNKPLEIILCAAIYQLVVLKLPSYAVLNESVKTVKPIDFEWASGFINAVLRNITRSENLSLQTDKSHDHPFWLAKRLRNAYPDQADTLFNANHHAAHVMLRVRPQSEQNRDDYLHTLSNIPITAKAHIDNKEAIVLTQSANVADLPGFKHGQITVQDANAQLAANLLGVKTGMRVLDACAAPGGKTAHIFDKADNLDLTALDTSAERVATMKNTFTRLNIAADIKTAPLEKTSDWYSGKPFERILLDAPCSATGVIRKHPDILFHRRESDISDLTTIQATLLDTCWSLLADGGRLLYATCSILPEENIEQITAFVARTPNAILRPLGHNRALENDTGTLQFLPNEWGDGFFYALLEKQQAD